MNNQAYGKRRGSPAKNAFHATSAIPIAAYTKAVRTVSLSATVPTPPLFVRIVHNTVRLQNRPFFVPPIQPIEGRIQPRPILAKHLESFILEVSDHVKREICLENASAPIPKKIRTSGRKLLFSISRIFSQVCSPPPGGHPPPGTDSPGEYRQEANRNTLSPFPSDRFSLSTSLFFQRNRHIVTNISFSEL
jgi:hypothetical protein